MSERVLNTHSKGERVKIPLLPKQSKIKGARQRQWSRQLVTKNVVLALESLFRPANVMRSTRSLVEIHNKRVRYRQREGKNMKERDV